jgi:ferredoxin
MEPLDSYLLDDAQRDAGYTLLCCTHPRSDMLLLTHQEADMYTKPYNM